MAAGFVGQLAASGGARDPLCHLRLPLTNHQSLLTVLTVPGVPGDVGVLGVPILAHPIVMT
jgi:hypothetical protein